MVGPEARAPDLALTSAFHTPAPLPAAPLTTAATPAPDLRRWWRAFDDPELSRAVERAGAQNLDLAAAEARLTQSRAFAKRAAAALLPSLAAKASAAAVSQSLDSPIGEIGRHLPGFERAFEEEELGAAGAWEIDLFGGLRRERQAAKAGARSAAFAAEAVKIQVEAEAADAYVQVRADQARLDVARGQERTEADLVALIDRLVAEGASPERELHEAEAALERVRASVPPLKTALELHLNRLDLLMGAQPGTFRGELLAKGALPRLPAVTAGATPADLLRRRPDIMAAEQRVISANARIGAAIAGYYPRVSLEGLFGVDSITAAGLFTGAAVQRQVGAGLTWRLFDFGRVDAEVAAAKGEGAEALAAYRSTVFKAAQDVENAFTAMAQEQARAAVLTREIADLALARRQAESAYEGGVISLVEVRDADRDLLTASDDLVQAQEGALRAAIASFRALGGGWAGAAPAAIGGP
jgi:NodT family efflux transporter outer membrane factor (OMF) lipoprotein